MYDGIPMRGHIATVLALALTAALLGCGDEEEEYVWDDGARFFIGSAGSSDTSLAWSPLGNVLLYTSALEGNPNLYAYDRVTDPVKVSGTSGNECVGPNGCWTAATNPGLIAYVELNGDTTARIRTRTGDLGIITTLLEDSAGQLIHPSWSPQGDMMVYSARDTDSAGASWQLYAADYQDGQLSDIRSLVGEPGCDLLRPSFSPAGGTVLYQRYDGTQTDIWMVNADGSNPMPVIQGSSDDIHPSWSPYEGWFVFSSDRDGDYEVYAASLDSDTLIRITNDPSQDIYPAWNPTISEIVFSADRNSDNFDIYYIEEPALPR
jgi:Tol biopolymer transport system component